MQRLSPNILNLGTKQNKKQMLLSFTLKNEIENEIILKSEKKKKNN